MRKHKNFWDRNAGRYNRFMRKDRAEYDEMYELIRPVVKAKTVLYDLTPALCRLDYTMSEAGGVTDFVRQHTLAAGGPYCDCGYKKKGLVKAGTEAEQ